MPPPTRTTADTATEKALALAQKSAALEKATGRRVRSERAARAAAGAYLPPGRVRSKAKASGSSAAGEGASSPYTAVIGIVLAFLLFSQIIAQLVMNWQQVSRQNVKPVDDVEDE